MGREIRMVPPNWKHPVGPHGLQPMFDRTYEEAGSKWVAEFIKWHVDKKYPSYAEGDSKKLFYWDWEDMPPDKRYYRPWKAEEATWFQVWETVTEGTPVTPPFATKDELIAYLAENGDAWDNLSDRPPWGIARATAFVNAGWAPSGVLINGTFHEGTSLKALGN